MKSILFSLIFAFTSIGFAKQVVIDKKSSSIEWVGQKKIPGGDHKGTVQLKKGTVNINEKNQVIGGTIIIDMTSIDNKDLTGEWKKKLEGHLKSNDFFDVTNHKEASFKVTKVAPTRSDLFNITGNLTLRGKTNPETFQLKIEKKGTQMIATGTIKFDRNKYGITYNSETNVLKKAVKIAADKIIKDEIMLTVSLKTTKI